MASTLPKWSVIFGGTSSLACGMRAVISLRLSSNSPRAMASPMHPMRAKAKDVMQPWLLAAMNIEYVRAIVADQPVAVQSPKEGSATLLLRGRVSRTPLTSGSSMPSSSGLLHSHGIPRRTDSPHRSKRRRPNRGRSRSDT
jgi:hypothetical protein